MTAQKGRPTSRAPAFRVSSNACRLAREPGSLRPRKFAREAGHQAQCLVLMSQPWTRLSHASCRASASPQPRMFSHAVRSGFASTLTYSGAVSTNCSEASRAIARPEACIRHELELLASADLPGPDVRRRLGQCAAAAVANTLDLRFVVADSLLVPSPPDQRRLSMSPLGYLPAPQPKIGSS